VRKAIIYALIAVIIGVIFLSINTISQNDDIEESIAEDEVNGEGPEPKPQGRNISIELDENIGFSAP
jgi:multisubunit Na+/H+ antiporter MnhB subunit